jgi:hypothetical protein
MGRTVKVMDEYGTHYILESIIMYGKGTKNGCQLYCKGGKDYHCPLCITDFLLEYIGLGFHGIHKSTLININHVMRNRIFRVNIVIMFDKVRLKVSALRQRDFVTLKIKSWIGLGQ